jgi:DNA-binding PadR family transcriptional regulator
MGLIASSWQELPGGRQRRYYNITDKGLRLLAVRKIEWRDFLAAMNLIIQPAST